MARIKFSASEIITAYPSFGQAKMLRTDAKGEVVGNSKSLTGWDYNREAMVRMLRESAEHRNMRADAVGIMLEEDRRYRKTQFWEEPERPLAAEEFVPMDPEAANFADVAEYAYEKRTRAGRAEFHTSLNGITEAPNVSEKSEWDKTKILNGIISWDWTVEDEMYASRVGLAVAQSRANTARDALRHGVDVLWLLGSAGFESGELGGLAIDGLFTQSGVAPLTSATAGVTGDWAGAATPDSILADVRKLYEQYLDSVRKTGANSNQDKPDTIAFSDRMESLLMHTDVDSTNRTSLLDMLKKRYPEIKNWLPHPDLRDLGGAGVDRLVMYKKDPKVVAGALPVPYQERPLIQQPFGAVVYAYNRVAPVVLHDARLFGYLDVASVAP